jgi:hypothetical protein
VRQQRGFDVNGTSLTEQIDKKTMNFDNGWVRALTKEKDARSAPMIHRNLPAVCLDWRSTRQRCRRASSLLPRDNHHAELRRQPGFVTNKGWVRQQRGFDVDGTSFTAQLDKKRQKEYDLCQWLGTRIDKEKREKKCTDDSWKLTGPSFFLA